MHLGDWWNERRIHPSGHPHEARDARNKSVSSQHIYARDFCTVQMIEIVRVPQACKIQQL